MASVEEQPFRQRAQAWIRQHPWWIALAVLYVLVWWLVPLLLYRHTDTDKTAKLEAITSTRTALLAGLIGVGALLTFWLNSRVYRISAETLRVTEQGQITDRYSKAIEHLGSDKLDVRLGGIYALERIAVDSERDHPTVVEVLSAFIREHSDPAPSDSKPSIAKVLSTFLEGQSEPTSNQEPDIAQSRKDHPTSDVRAALRVLARLPTRSDVARADLFGIRFANAALRWSHLSGFVLMGANLQQAKLFEAHLDGARLDGADLQGADLEGADLQGAYLKRADLRGATLKRAHLGGAQLEQAQLQGVDLTDDVRGLTREQLQTAFTDDRTRLPAELEEPNHSDASDSAQS